MNGGIARPVDFARLTDKLRGGAPFVEHLGVRLDDVGPGSATATLPAAPTLLNAGGSVHAGALFGLIDVAAGAAVYGLMAGITPLRELWLATADASVEFQRAASGALVARSVVDCEADDAAAAWDSGGRLDLTVLTTVTDGSDEIVASARQRCVVRRARSGGEEKS